MTVLISDTWTRTATGTGAGTADGGSDSSKTWTTVKGVDANVNINGSQLVCLSDWGGKVGTATAANVEQYVEFSNFGAATGVFKHATLALRYADEFNTYYTRWNNDQDATDVGALEIMRVAAGVSTRIGLLGSQTRLTAFNMRAQCETTASSVILRLRWWTGGEPGTWNLTATDTDATRILSGVHGLRTFNAGSASNTTMDNYSVSSMATATLSGTALAGINETDIRTGGKTIIITLSGDTWIP